MWVCVCVCVCVWGGGGGGGGSRCLWLDLQSACPFFFQTKTVIFYMQLWGTHTYAIYVGDHPIPSLGFTAFCN